MAKKRAKRTTSKATSAVVAGKLSNCAKDEALIVYVDQLVQKKLTSKKKRRRLDKSE